MFGYLTRPEKCDAPIVDDPIGLDQDECEKGRRSSEVVWLGRGSEEEEEDASDVCSPPLWKTSNSLVKYNQLSPAAKARAVVRAQQELMEIMEKMPESSYELSLKDIVEHKHRRQIEPHKPCGNAPIYTNKNPVSQFTKEALSSRKMYGIMERSRNVDNEKFLLKMILPFDFRSKSKKRIVLNDSKQGCSEVSPRPSSAGTSDGSSRFGDTECIRRTVKSHSGRAVSSTSRNRSRHSGGICLTGCWSVLSFKKKVFED